jgi:site-specific DNA recombinase
MLDGVLFYKVDWAARNLYDYVELERVEEEYGVKSFTCPSRLRTHRLAAIRKQEDELLNLRLLGEIESATFLAKRTNLRDRESCLNLQIEACDRGRHENADLAVKAFELSQTLPQRWVTADYGEKRRYLEIVVLNFSLDAVSLVPEWRKPFDVLAKGLSIQPSRGDRI